MQRSYDEKKSNSERKITYNLNLPTKNISKLFIFKIDKDKLEVKLSESEIYNNTLKDKNEYISIIFLERIE